MPRLVKDATGNDLTFRIIGAAMDVHNRIGPGYKEEIYENALFAELQSRSNPAEDQYPIDVFDGDVYTARFYLDIYIIDQVVVEIKAYSHLLTNDDYSQVINYLKATQAPVGLLFNFGQRRLEYHRVFPGKNASPPERLGRDDVRKSYRNQ
jgi:GxxExxY protein